ncbi:hypothetical protein MDAP_000273 [Mitosporidium daphniae]|uniref:Uncharacterized protein n=1 Tax=Mitosporidium daphniae TaxID=1485682 RepID=A0A098VVB2_9MICR|nr:uncharacterized protein DI09_12p250 [Mitosporidium daphniae]KGG52857.1 hypothetical protein DI09_12p250 [Mitosporidium daphniae]|eukprot:XP_013239284.1 uncharacterized protein DI09_12p250 [Mitosporidium daphniae]
MLPPTTRLIAFSTLLSFASPLAENQIPTTGVWAFHTEPISILTRNLGKVPVYHTQMPSFPIENSDLEFPSITSPVDSLDGITTIIQATTSEIILKATKVKGSYKTIIQLPAQHQLIDGSLPFQQCNPDNEIGFLVGNCETPRTVTAFIPIIFSHVDDVPKSLIVSTLALFSAIPVEKNSPNTMMGKSSPSAVKPTAINSCPMASALFSSLNPIPAMNSAQMAPRSNSSGSENLAKSRSLQVSSVF